MRLIELLILSSSFDLVLACEKNIKDIFNLYENNEEYARLSNSWPPKIEEIREDLTNIPSFVGNAKKYFLCYYDQNQLIAVLDFLDGYKFQVPNCEDTIWIGLLELNPQYKRKYIGTRLMKELIECCQVCQKKRIQLGVIKENIKGLKFWESLGFHIIKEGNNNEFDLYILELKIEAESSIIS